MGQVLAPATFVASADHKWIVGPFSELLNKLKGRWIAVDAPDQDMNVSKVKTMSKFRAKHLQAPREIF